jgi:hypothetical protein
MQRYAVVIALLIWAIPVVVFGRYLTNVEYASLSERITVVAIFGIGSLVGAITISIAARIWSSTYDFAGRRADLTGVVTTVKSGPVARGLASKATILALVLVVTAMSVLVYRLDQRVSDLEGRPNTRSDISSQISSAVNSAYGDLSRRIENEHRYDGFP